MAMHECRRIESEVVDRYPLFRQGLIDARVDQQRRSMRVRVPDLDCRQHASDLVLGFSLPAGSYATMVLREVLEAT